MPIQAFAFEVKSLSEQGQFEGLASTYGNTDLVGDVMMPGCFTRTLASNGQERPLLFEHRTPIGLVTLSDSEAGLVAKGRLTMSVQAAADACALLRDRVVRGLSIGFQCVQEKFAGDVRQILECKLFEVSLVCFPANENATVTAVKSARLDEISRAARDLRAFYNNLKRQ